MKKSLIVGIDGQIGSELNKIIDGSILGATIFPNLVSNNCEFLDLSENISGWTPPSEISFAYLCAAICSINKCEKNPVQSRIVNVRNTVLLAKKLVDSGAFVLFPSTNMVFDGQKPDYKENDTTCPLNGYGKQKAETEKLLLEIGNCAIIRFTKIIGPEFPIIKNWIKDLKDNIPICPFSDMKIAPVSLNFAASAMKVIGESKSPGIWHISGDYEITYEEAARYIAEGLNVSESLIKPLKASEKGITSLLNYTTLNADKIKNKFNLKIVNPFEIINSNFNL